MSYKDVYVGIPTIVYGEGLERAVVSCELQDLKVEVMVIRNGPKVDYQVQELEGMHRIGAVYPETNWGVSKSWNKLCEWAYESGYEHAIIIGDDIEFVDQDATRKFDEAVKENPKAVYFVYDRGFSAFCLPKAVYEEIGGFDEEFWPGYFEDNDYYRRMMLAGIGWQGLFINTTHVGSASINTDPELRTLNNQFFPLNRDRYIAKWGGPPHMETFTTPGGPE